MLKPRQVLAKGSNGKLQSLHLSEDAVAAKSVFHNLRANGGEGYHEVVLLGPWGVERHHKFHTPAAAVEIKPAKAVKAAR